MAIHPGQGQPRQQIAPLPRRPRERVAGGVFRAVTKLVGFRAEMIPDHLRRQLRIIGASDTQLRRVFTGMRSLSDWPYVWENEADSRFAEGDWDAAFAAYYVAQRILLAPSPLKDRLYQHAVTSYANVKQPPLERFSVLNGRGEKISGYLQMPEKHKKDKNSPVACVLVVPGITGTKEELHPFVMPMLKRSIAVARIDNPTYGETEGHLTLESVTNPRYVIDFLSRDPRLDPNSIHLYGMSLGANFAIASTVDSKAASLSVICAPFEPSRYFKDLPTLNLIALQHMAHQKNFKELMKFAAANDRAQDAAKISVPVRIFHAGRDRTIPVEDAHLLAGALSGPSALTIYQRDHHNCLEHLNEITASILEFIADPYEVCSTLHSTELLSDPASISVTDEDAQLLQAGVIPSRRAARLPFMLPWMRPRSK